MNVIILLFHISDNKFEGYTQQGLFRRCKHSEWHASIALFFRIYIPKSLIEEAQCLSLHKTQQKTRKMRKYLVV